MVTLFAKSLFNLVSSALIISPSIVYPTDPAISGESVFLPSRARTLRLLQQMVALVNHRNFLFGTSAYAALIGVFRFLLFFTEFPNTILTTLAKIYWRVRWVILPASNQLY